MKPLFLGGFIVKLILTNGYPYPLPKEFDFDTYDPEMVDIEGVVHFEWKHTLTVGFDSWARMEAIQKRSGWRQWVGTALEAKTSVDDGYGHPAIVFADKAYCGFILLD